MKIFFIILFFSLFKTGFGQAVDCGSNISKLKVTIFRNLGSIVDVECDYTGATLLQIYKEKDSLKIKTLYASCQAHNLEDNSFLKKQLNKLYKDSITGDCKIILPFYWNDDDAKSIYKPSEKIKNEMNEMIAIQKGKQGLILEPLEITMTRPKR